MSALPTRDANESRPDAESLVDEKNALDSAVAAPEAQPSLDETEIDEDEDEEETNEDEIDEDALFSALFPNDDDEEEEEEEEEVRTFAQKLYNALKLFAWGNFISLQEFAVAFGISFVAFALSLSLLSLSFATVPCPRVIQTIFRVLGTVGVLGASGAFLLATLNRFNDAYLFFWRQQTSQEQFLLAAFKHFGLSFVWCGALLLTVCAGAWTLEAYDDRSLFVGGLCASGTWFFGALSLFGLAGSTLALAKTTTQRFHDADLHVWNARGWLGQVSRQDYLIALVNHGVASFAAAAPYALACALFGGLGEEILLGFLAAFSCFAIWGLIFSPFLLPATAKRLRGLGLDPRATLLFLLVPAPFLALTLVALSRAQPETAPAPEPEPKPETATPTEDDDIPF